MKFLSLAVLALLGSTSEAVRIQKKEKAHISIDITKTPYKNERLDQIMAQQPSEEFMHSLAQSFGLPQAQFQTLVEKHQKKSPTGIDLINLKNMGYEGQFWFGNPSQTMQVVFDTGSAWVWVFSETCKKNNCPMKNKKYEQSKSQEFKINPKAGQMLAYGKGAILGHPSQDRVCFSQDDAHCLHKMSFLSVVKAADLSALKGSGLVGLAPTPMKKEEHDAPMTHGIPGFVAQLKDSKDFNSDFDSVFSIYLSNDENVKGNIIFGGANLEKYAKKGLKEDDIQWFAQSSNDAYWASNLDKASFGKKVLTKNKQQVIFDNGMSFAMAPEKSFIQMAKTLFKEHGIFCQPNQPLWSCSQCTDEKLAKLPSLKFDIVTDKSGKTKTVEMPATSYLRKDENFDDVAWLLLTPWEFQGIGGKKGEEYWVLGAQFLQNYYSIYDFSKGKIGLVESVSSALH